MIPAAPLRVTAPRFMHRAIFVTCYGAGITIKVDHNKEGWTGKTSGPEDFSPHPCSHPAVRGVSPAQVFERVEFVLDMR
jgi:hypothetical protein